MANIEKHPFWSAVYKEIDNDSDIIEEDEGTENEKIWLKIDLGDPELIAGYFLECHYIEDSFGWPSAWILFGYNDAHNDDDSGTWIEVDSQSGIHWQVTSSSHVKKEFAVYPTGAYRWYKIVILSAVGRTTNPPDYVCIKRLQFYSAENRTTVRDAEVEFIYTFHPAYIDRIVLQGDAAFRDRIGDIAPIETDTGEDEQESGDEDNHEQSNEENRTETGYTWSPIGGGLFETTIPVRRKTDSIHLCLDAGKTAIYHAIRIYTDEENLISASQKFHVKYKTFLMYDTADGTPILRLTAGMSGSLIYRSEEPRRISQIEIICNANARARLLNEGFKWQGEDLGESYYWREIKTFEEDPPSSTEYIFHFSGIDSEGNAIGEGVIRSIRFYAAPQGQEPPICVEFDVIPSIHRPAGIAHYLDETGRYHCVSADEVRFTASEIDDLRQNPATETILHLETEYGKVRAHCEGILNVDCLLLSQD